MQKSFHDGMLDITMCEDVEIKVSQLGNLDPVLHVNTREGCVLRICMIRGKIVINEKLNNKENFVIYSSKENLHEEGDLENKGPE